MLPDFASMIGVRLPGQKHERLSSGIEFHHRSDKIFHQLSGFREHEQWTLQHMLEAGLRRGPARGVAHVGVELSLDGALVGDRTADALYLRAIELALSDPPSFSERADAARFEGLATRLHALGLPTGYRDQQTVAERLIRILQPRPLLRLQAHEEALLLTAVGPMHDRVAADAAEIMSSLARALSDAPGATSDESWDRENREAES